MSDPIRDAERVKQFLTDPAVVAVFARLEKSYHDEFLAAATQAAILTAHAKAKALRDLKSEFTVTVERGETAATRAAREARPTSPPRR